MHHLSTCSLAQVLLCPRVIVCVCVKVLLWKHDHAWLCVVVVCVEVLLWNSENNLQESEISFHCVWLLRNSGHQI